MYATSGPPSSGQFWNSETSKMVKFFEIAKTKAQDETPNLGEHEKVVTE